MPFSQKKFLSLAPANRAKKLADLLEEYVQTRMSGRPETVPVEYNRLLTWFSADEDKNINDIHQIKRPATPADDFHINAPDNRRLLSAYIHWRRQAGLGPRESICRQIGEIKRAPLSEPPLHPSAASSAFESERLNPPKATRLPWDILLHDLRSGHNVGSIFRTADCFGLGKIFLSGYTCGPENKSLAAAAMGSETWLESSRVTNVLEFIKGYKQNANEEDKLNPAHIVALEITEDAVPLQDFVWPERGLLIPGNEELGISPEILEQADEILSIPLYGRKNSLNVSQAFALVAWEIRKSSAPGNLD